MLKDTDEESTRLIIWTIDGLVENYEKNKIINKIINYEYEDSYRSSRSDIREFLWVNADYDYYYPTYKYRGYRQNREEAINVEWYSKMFNFVKYYEDIKDMIFKVQVDNQEYKLDLSDYLDELKEKSNIYAKSDFTDEEKEILKKPALEVSEENYKIVINGFSLEENKQWENHFTNIEWYILIK